MLQRAGDAYRVYRTRIHRRTHANTDKRVVVVVVVVVVVILVVVVVVVVVAVVVVVVVCWCAKRGLRFELKEEKRNRRGRGTSYRQKERGGPRRVLTRMSEINPPPTPFRFIYPRFLSFSHLSFAPLFLIQLGFLPSFLLRSIGLSFFACVFPTHPPPRSSSFFFTQRFLYPLVPLDLSFIFVLLRSTTSFLLPPYLFVRSRFVLVFSPRDSFSSLFIGLFRSFYSFQTLGSYLRIVRRLAKIKKRKSSSFLSRIFGARAKGDFSFESPWNSAEFLRQPERFCDTPASFTSFFFLGAIQCCFIGWYTMLLKIVQISSCNRIRLRRIGENDWKEIDDTTRATSPAVF